MSLKEIKEEIILLRNIGEELLKKKVIITEEIRDDVFKKLEDMRNRYEDNMYLNKLVVQQELLIKELHEELENKTQELNNYKNK